MIRRSCVVALVWILIQSWGWAGGPLFVDADGVPFRWGGEPVVVRIYPDAGGLGPMDSETALAALLFAAEQWSEVPSASITLQNAGFVEAVVGPEGAGDFSAETAFDFIGINNGGVTPIIFDNEDADDNGNGDLFDLLGLSGGVLGISFPEFANGTTITEGVALFNGAAVDPADTSGEAFRGVMTHELGHLLGLAHSVVNGQALFFGGTDAETPDGQPLLPGPEDVETMYPFVDPSPGGTASQLATLHRDDIAILSTLYPNPEVPLDSFGSIRGHLLESGVLPRTGAQIIARNQAGDPLQDAVSAISGDYTQYPGADRGSYLLNGMTPGGQYSLELRDTVAGGFSTPVFNSPDWFMYSGLGLLPGPEEYFSGPNEAWWSPPDDPGAPPFLIDLEAGGPSNPFTADLLLNLFSSPGNDACENAVQIRASALPFSDRRQTQGARTEMREPSTECGHGTGGKSVWYQFRNDTLQGSDFVFSAEGSSYDTIIQVYTGSCQVPNSVPGSCSNSLESGRSVLRFPASPGTTHMIKVVDPSDAPRGGELHFQVRALDGLVPSNDSCSSSLQITNLDLPYSSEIDTMLATTLAGEPSITCAYPGPDPLDASVWYRFTNTEAVPIRLTASTSETDYDTAIQAFTGDCLHAQPTVCDDDSGEPYWFNSELRVGVEPGQSILFKVGGYGGGGNLVFRLDRAEPPPPNDDQENAVVLSRRDLPFVALIDTTDAGNQPAEPETQCGSPDVPEQSASVWYRLTNDLVIPMNIELSTAGSQFDTVIQVYTAGDSQSTLTPLACDDDSGPGLLSDLVFRAEPGESYRIKVASWGEGVGGTLLFTAGVQDAGLTSGDLVLTAVQPDSTPTARGELAYTMDLRNLVENPATNVRLDVHLAPDLEFLSAETPRGNCIWNGDVDCSLGTVGAGEDLLLKITTSPRQAGTTSLTAVLSWDESEGAEDSRSASIVSKVAPFLIFPFSLRSATTADPGGAAPNIGTDFVGSAVVNPGEAPGNLVLEGLDAQGERLFLSNPAAVLDGLGQKAFTEGDLGPGVVGSATLLARGTTDPLEGFFMSGDSRLTRLDGIGGELVDSKTLYFQIARETATESTRIFLFNPMLMPADAAEIVLFDAEGQPVARKTVSIPSDGVVYDSLRDLLEIPESFDGGYVRVESPVPLRGFEFHGNASYLEALPARPVEPVSSLWSPHFFLDDQGGRTDLRLLSLDQGIVEVEVQAFGDNGAELGTTTLELKPGQLMVADVGEIFELSAPTGQPLSGYLHLILEPQGYVGPFAPRVRVMGSVSFTAQAGRARSTLSLVRTARYRTWFLHVAQSPALQVFTGLALLNTSYYTTSTVELKAVDSAGHVTAETTIKIEPGTRKLGLLTDPDFFGETFEQVGGHLELDASYPIIPFALFGDFSSQYLSAIEGQPE
ncbi:MAG: hypothetical protein P8020_16580 [Acidobacteriota bacterium]